MTQPEYIQYIHTTNIVLHNSQLFWLQLNSTAAKAAAAAGTRWPKKSLKIARQQQQYKHPASSTVFVSSKGHKWSHV